jgi:hypothetical protein
LHWYNHILVIQMFSIINLHGSFSLSPIKELIGYADLQQD